MKLTVTVCDELTNKIEKAMNDYFGSNIPTDKDAIEIIKDILKDYDIYKIGEVR